MIEDAESFVDWIVYAVCAVLIAAIWWRVLSDWAQEKRKSPR